MLHNVSAVAVVCLLALNDRLRENPGKKKIGVRGGQRVFLQTTSSLAKRDQGH